MSPLRLRLEMHADGALATPSAAAIAAAEERFLEELGARWGSEAELLGVPPGWLEGPSGRRAAARIDRLLDRPIENSTAVADRGGLQDSRVSLLLPLWQQLGQRKGFCLRPVLCTESMEPLRWSEQRHLWHRLRRFLLDAAATGLLPRLEGGPLATGRCHGESLVAGVENRELEEPPLPWHPRLRRLRRQLDRLSRLPAEQQGKALRAQIVRLAGEGPEQLPSGPEHVGGWRRRGIALRLRLLPPLEPGPWFDPAHYRRQLPALPADHDPLAHYRWRGWRLGLSPHPLFDPAYYLQGCRQQGAFPAADPLAHFLEVGLARRIPPSPTTDPDWFGAAGEGGHRWRTGRLDALHPWGAAALALSDGAQEEACATLRRWQGQGFTRNELEAIATAPANGFRFSAAGLDPAISDPPWQGRKVVPFGCGPLDWPLHGWLQHCPMKENCRPFPEAQGDIGPLEDHAWSAGTFGLWLGPVAEGESGARALRAAARLDWVFSPSGQVVRLLRRLGIRARRLAAGRPVNGWLEATPERLAEAVRRLGLPPPAALRRGGGPSAALLCLGSGGEAWERNLEPPLWCWPGFDAVRIQEPEEARLLAAWLNDCSRQGLQLVRIAPTPLEHQRQAWEALERPVEPPAHWLPPQCFLPPLTPQECREELHWRGSGRRPPATPLTPQPEHRLLWGGEGVITPTAAVCISLFNYAARIDTALASVRDQTHTPLELIVVDDASEDDGPERVRAWLEIHGHRFARALLLRHADNGGLAAARNTAFATALSPWCFVLDADNLLEPEAVRLCLAIASASPASTAVVHPLVELRSEGRRPGQPSGALLGGIAWQRSALEEGNQIDAMALVRKEAWRSVGGYSHIPGGWEDYDFWCKLIDAGYHGVLCPQRLAVYFQHQGSMQATNTLTRQRALSRLLRTRHPWLRISPDLAP